MARAILNSAISQACGRVGDVELRRYKGITVLQKAQRRHRPWSQRQQLLRRHFQLHLAYAARVRADPVLRAIYDAAAARRTNRLNYWQLAIRDHANPPVVSGCELRDVRRGIAGSLRITARDDSEVTRVCVALRDASGTLLGFADATPCSPCWEYPIPPPSPGQGRAASVVVTAFDRPGNFAIATYPIG